MENRDLITRKELVSCVEAVKMDISKGAQNPAHSWIRKLSFSKNAAEHENDFYEGKKSNSCGYSKKSSGITSNARGENYNVYTRKYSDCNKSLQRAGKDNTRIKIGIVTSE